MDNNERLKIKTADMRVAKVLDYILQGYLTGREYNYSLDYSIKGFSESTELSASEIEFILGHLLERKVIDGFREGGGDLVITEDTYVVYFPQDFPVRAKQYLDQLAGKQSQSVALKQEVDLPTQEIIVGKLVSYSDGSIAFGGASVSLRAQLKILLRLFMANVGHLVLIDDIREELISSDLQQNISNDTLSKYVSGLHKELRELYGKKVIFNQKTEGWIFNPEDS